MEPFTCPGTYTDDQGVEDLVWSFEQSRQEGWQDCRFEIRTTIRGIAISGTDFDILEPESDPADPVVLPLNLAGELGPCILTGELPCIVHVEGRVVSPTIRFRLDLRTQDRPTANLTLTCAVGGVGYTVVDDWFEGGLLRLEQALPDGVRIKACITCLYSDYSPAGHGLTGMICHRNHRQSYLAVRSKRDYWNVPETEQIPEIYLCPEYQRRLPGTGYRG